MRSAGSSEGIIFFFGFRLALIQDFFQLLDSIALKNELPAEAPKDVLNVCINLATPLLTEGLPELLSLLTDAGTAVKSSAVAFLIYSLREICERTIQASERFKSFERTFRAGNSGLN